MCEDEREGVRANVNFFLRAHDLLLFSTSLGIDV